MRQNILNNFTRNTESKLYNKHYYDFMLYKGHVSEPSDIKEKVIADFCNMTVESGKVFSDITWEDAVSEGVDLQDIGLTGVDNGFIAFRKDMVSNSEFLDLFLHSKYSIASGDTRLFFTPVQGNSQIFSYPLAVNHDEETPYLSCKGGFLQGFFKLHGFDYQVLPSKLDHDLTLHFDLRPRNDYEVKVDSVNYVHPENKGIFFFLGTRAENKFWPFYKTDSAVTETLKKADAANDGYFDGCGSGETYDLQSHVVDIINWLADEPDADITVGGKTFSVEKEDLPSGTTAVMLRDTEYLNTYNFNSDSQCGCPVSGNPCDSGSCDTYFTDDYFSDDCRTDRAIEDEYIEEDEVIIHDGYSTSDGHELKKNGYEEIETDNKFLLFDRTDSGFTVDTWVEGTKVVLERRQAWPNINYFLLFDRTDTGYTVETIDKYNETHQADYNIYKDIRDNAFALRVTDDGAIGYRYGVFDCDSENKYKVVEEYSKSGLINNNTWNSVNVRFALTGGEKMKIMIYVNGFLVFISKEVPAFNFKALDDDKEKQEGVPYSISLGGGTLGLLETILPDYYAIPEYILPLEKDFCGTFLGDIKSFKIYYGDMDYFAIKNYLS